MTNNIKLIDLLYFKGKISNKHIVLEQDKSYYMRVLKEYKNDKMFLIDTIEHEQDLYEDICNKLLNFEIEDK